MKKIKDRVVTPDTKFYAYYRESTKTQADKGSSHQNQKSAVQEYCINNGIEIFSSYYDRATSGSTKADKKDEYKMSSRPELWKLVFEAEENSFVIVYSTDRLWRHEYVSDSVMEAFKEKNIEVISVQNQIFTLYPKDPYQKYAMKVMSAVDELNCEIDNERRSVGKNVKAKQGHKPSGRLPIGYKYDNKHRYTIIDKKNVKYVKLIFDKRIAGQSFQQIADLMAKKTGKKWSKQTISKIIKNDFYKGILTHNGEKIEGKHEPIIDECTWTRANSM